MSAEIEKSGGRAGLVYILTNTSMPGLVKIGRTTREVDVRASELWQTGVPTPFEVYYCCSTLDCVQLEAFVHGALHSKRVSRSREFFRVEPEQAVATLNKWVLLQAQILIGEMGRNLVVSTYATSVSHLDIERLAEELQQPVRIIANAMECLTGAELRAAVERVRSRLEADDPEFLKILDENAQETRESGGRPS